VGVVWGLPTHKQHIALVANRVAIADANAVRIEAAWWAVLKDGLVMLGKHTAPDNVDVHRAD
jgi:hypothetical protein